MGLRPVFIGGTGRCGTTVLGRLLGHHPSYAVIPVEARFHAEPRGVAGVVDGRIEPEVCARTILDDLFVAHRHPRHPVGGLNRIVDRPALEAALERFVEHAARDRSEACRRLVCDVLDPIAAQQGRPEWVEMTPRNILHGRTLYALFPEARFVHTVRDGRDVAASLAGLGWKPDFDTGLEWWGQRVRQCHRAGGLLPDAALHTLVFEDLLQDRREEAYAELLGFLGWEDQPAMHEYFDEQMTAAHAHIGRWRSQVPSERLDVIDERYGKLAEEAAAELGRAEARRVAREELAASADVEAADPVPQLLAMLATEGRRAGALEERERQLRKQVSSLQGRVATERTARAGADAAKKEAVARISALEARLSALDERLATEQEARRVAEAAGVESAARASALDDRFATEREARRRAETAVDERDRSLSSLSVELERERGLVREAVGSSRRAEASLEASRADVESALRSRAVAEAAGAESAARASALDERLAAEQDARRRAETAVDERDRALSSLAVELERERGLVRDAVGRSRRAEASLEAIRTDVESALQSRAWRWGHGLMRTGRRLSFRRVGSENALQRAHDRLERDPPPQLEAPSANGDAAHAATPATRADR